MRRILSMLLFGAAGAVSLVHLAGCDDDTTVNVAPFDSGAKEGGEGGEAGKTDAGHDGGASDGASDGATGATTDAAAD